MYILLNKYHRSIRCIRFLFPHLYYMWKISITTAIKIRFSNTEKNIYRINRFSICINRIALNCKPYKPLKGNPFLDEQKCYILYLY